MNWIIALAKSTFLANDLIKAKNDITSLDGETVKAGTAGIIISRDSDDPTLYWVNFEDSNDPDYIIPLYEKDLEKI